MRIFTWSLLAVIGTLLTSCGSSSSSTPVQNTAQSSDEPFAVISLGREPVSPFEPDLTAPDTYSDSNTNDITPEQVAAAGEFDFEDFDNAYNLLVSENPQLDPNSNEFALMLIDLLSIETANRASSSSGTYFQSFDTPISREYSRLTPGERLLIITNPVYGALTFFTVLEARDVSNTMFQESGQSLEDGRGDAFRHSYWNWLMSNCCSVLWAEAFGTAHELRADQPFDFYKLRMDLNNNQVGRDVYSANPSASKSAAQQALLTHDLEFVDHTIETINYDFSRLVYVVPRQSMTLFDDGPAFDDVYEITANNQVWGTTPKGGSKTIVLSRASSGEHSLSIKCLEDGTMYGCGFQFWFKGATVLSTGQQSTNDQILLEESDTYTETLTFPTIDVDMELD